MRPHRRVHTPRLVIVLAAAPLQPLRLLGSRLGSQPTQPAGQDERAPGAILVASQPLKWLEPICPCCCLLTARSLGQPALLKPPPPPTAAATTACHTRRRRWSVVQLQALLDSLRVKAWQLRRHSSRLLIMASGPAAAAAEPAGPRGHGRPSRQGPRLFRINQAIRAGDHEGLKQLLAQGPPPKVRWDLLGMQVQPSCCSPAGTNLATLHQRLLTACCAQCALPAQVPRLGEHGDFICFSYDGSEGSDFYGTRDEQDPFYTLLLEGVSQDSRVRPAACKCHSTRLTQPE